MAGVQLFFTMSMSPYFGHSWRNIVGVYIYLIFLVSVITEITLRRLEDSEIGSCCFLSGLDFDMRFFFFHSFV